MRFAGLLLSLLCALPTAAEPRLQAEDGWIQLFNGHDLTGWTKSIGDRDFPYRWFVASKAIPHRDDAQVMDAVAIEPPVRTGMMFNGKTGDERVANIKTEVAFGDVELYLEWMVTEGSNSGVYLQGLYELQVFDSSGKAHDDVKFSDAGGVYARYIDEKVVGGTAPMVNACRGPGEWQSFHIWFRAPRFDESGKKVANARFERVLLNGVEVQRDVDLPGPTRAHMRRAESARGPLMLQGDHGPVAFRSVSVRPLD